MTVSAIVPAAGRGRRFGSRAPKAFFVIDGQPLLVRTLKALDRAYSFKEIVVAVGARDQGRAAAILKKFRLSRVRLVEGGRTRAESVRNALTVSTGEWILVHDAARPMVSRRLVRAVIDAARRHGGAICAAPVTATVKRVDRRGILRGTEDRETLRLAQTPQVFRRSDLTRRYRALGRQALQATDEASLFDGTRQTVRCVDGEASNLKITTRDDVTLLRHFSKRESR